LQKRVAGLGDGNPLGERDLVLAFQFGVSASMSPTLNKCDDQTTQATDQQDHQVLNQSVWHQAGKTRKDQVAWSRSNFRRRYSR
jgi:hypothetical protein